MKSFFMTRLLREKVLLLLLAIGAAAMWLSSAGGRASAVWAEVKAGSATLQQQEIVLAEKSTIEARAQAAIQRLDPARTLDEVRLGAAVDSMLRTARITSASTGDSGPPERSNQFSVHSVLVTIRNADYGALVDFYTELEKRSPYVAVEKFTLTPNTANAQQVTAVLRLSSVEIER
jgi:hypothetical protein